MPFFKKTINHRRTRLFLLLAGVLAAGWGALLLLTPRRLFDAPASTLLWSAEGELLGARIAPDGQWRFPAADSVPEKFAVCLVNYEDRRFWAHPGVDPAALSRAVRDNFRARRVVSGGSTLTMQLARIARGNRERDLFQKAVESLWALSIEARYPKRGILALYAAHAPFGGNVVGVETAAWRYFGRRASELSWAESAALAVLPNAPALIHPGRNRERLKAKRDRLLRTLMERGVLDGTEYELACLEPLPEAPVPLPDAAPHLLERLAAESPGTSLHTSVRNTLQWQVQGIVDRCGREYASSHIHNLAALVADVETGEVLAYAGNVSTPGEARRGQAVDVIAAPRSTGSILKPFLYAGMLADGAILPGTLIADTPLDIEGFVPQNFDRTFSGAVPAHRALSRSLNVPLVRLLTRYNTGRFMELLKRSGMTTLRFSEDHYGASLILGGAEATLWDLCGMYASLSRTLGHFQAYDGLYDPADIHPLTVFPSEDKDPVRNALDDRLTDRAVLPAAAVWFTYEALSALGRPEEEADWQQFRSMKRVAWKTGTSWGGRDGWAVGTTPRYVVGVWAGNASGEGRPDLTGVGTAAPVLFEIFSLLPDGAWFEAPYDELVRMPICRLSGHKASAECTPVDTLWMPAAGQGTEVCPYHRTIHLSADGRWRVNSSCEPVGTIVARPWFVLPPAQAYYYRQAHADYVPLPPWRPGCESAEVRPIELIYPEHGAVLYLPRGLSGERERFVFRAAHARREATLYWHLDEEFLGQTVDTHEISCAPAPGKHVLTLADGWGNSRKIVFEVVENDH